MLTFACLPSTQLTIFTALTFSSDLQVCSSLLEKYVEEKHIFHALKKNNGYPYQFIIKQSRPIRLPLMPDTINRPKATVVLPYIWHVSESISRIQMPLEIWTCFKPHQTLGQLLVHHTNSIPPLQTLGVV